MIGVALLWKTLLSAENLGIALRGLLRQGYFADLVVFDPDRIQDHATSSGEVSLRRYSV